MNLADLLAVACDKIAKGRPMGRGKLVAESKEHALPPSDPKRRDLS